jgi:DNA-damage-inducible protein J
MKTNTASTTMIHVRVNNQIKTQAARVLAKMGLSISDAVRLLLIRVIAEKAMPFEISIPNTETSTAMKTAKRSQVPKPKPTSKNKSSEKNTEK